MSQRRHVFETAFALVLLGATGEVAARAAAAPAVDLSGTWVLNTEESDDPQEEYRRWITARGVGGSARGAAAPGTGAGDDGGSYDVAGGGGGQGMAAVGGALLAMYQRFSENTERLTIEQGDPEVTITNAAGQANMVFTDGRVVESEAEGGGKTKVKTRWKKDKMIIDVDFPTRPNPMGGTLTPSLGMTYSLDKSGRLLLASTVGIGATVPPLTIERVYDRGAAVETPTESAPAGEPAEPSSAEAPPASAPPG